MNLRHNVRVPKPCTSVERRNYGYPIKGNTISEHFDEQLEGLKGSAATDEGGVVYGVLVRVGDFVEQFARVGRRRACGVEVKEDIAEEVVGGREEAGDGGSGVELLAGAESGSAGAFSEKRTEAKSTLRRAL